MGQSWVERWFGRNIDLPLLFAFTLVIGVMVMGQVIAEFDPNEPIGKRPYEMEWANRKEPRPPTITFSNLQGWRMEVEGGAVAIFRPSREQNIWDRPVGKLTYRGNGDPNSRPKILLYPPKPIPIPDGSDCVDAWIYGNRWGWENPPDTPPVQIFLHLRDGKGQVQRVHLTTVNWKEWWLAHRRLFPLPQGGETKGWEFIALEIVGGWQPQDRTIYLDSLTFYREPLLPLKFPPRPKRNLTLFEGQSPGLNIGGHASGVPIFGRAGARPSEKKLEFPTREETILPINLTKRFRTEAKREGNLFVFRYIGSDCTVTYRFDPAKGLSGITAVVEHRARDTGQVERSLVIQPLAGAGVKFADGGQVRSEPQSSSGVASFDGTSLRSMPNYELEDKLVRAELRNGVVTARYESGVIYRLRLWQKSLVLDVIWVRSESRSGSGAASSNGTTLRSVPNYEPIEVSFGEIRLPELSTPHSALRTIYVPFITYGGSNPVVAMVGGGTGDKGRGVFVSIWLDWYRSNGSEPYAFPDGQFTPTGLRINGGVRYHPKTDGKRNDVFERIFVTVSPTFEEVLPVIPNPKGLHAHLAVDRLWQESWGPENYEREMERSRRLRAYGIVKLIQCNHEITWRDGGESFTLRTKAAPGKGGDEALKRYLEHQKSLGWFAGLYTNYCDFAPVNEFWNPDFVQRTPEGEWRPAWPRCYALKPAAAVMFHEKLAPIIKRKFHVCSEARSISGVPSKTPLRYRSVANYEHQKISAYTDVHTAVAPWHYCDYDARVPGAGTFAQTFYCYGELLRNDSRIYGGPIFSEGTFQWLYAGLADGNYGLTYNGRPIAKEPLLPVFFLREIHTKECDIGMGWTDWFLQGVPDWQKDVDKAIDRFLLHIIAYGTIGWLVEERFGMERVCRSYYMLQRLQTRYGLLPPKQIAYWDGKRLVSVSEAIERDLPRTRRQMFIAYPNGLNIWVNDWDKGHGTGDTGVWRVEVNGKVYEIPPAGWLAVQGREFLTFSALIDGRKVDYLRDAKGYSDEPPLLYADGRGELTRFEEVATKGAIAVRRIGERQIEVIDISRTSEFGLKNPLGVKGFPAKCEIFDIDGKSLGMAEIRLTPDYAWVIGKPNGHKYVVSYGTRDEGRGTRTRMKATAGDWWIEAETHEAAPGAKLVVQVSSKGQGTRDKCKTDLVTRVRLSCEGANLSQTKDGWILHIPEDAPIGKRIWVRAELDGQIRWWDITVVPMVRWKLDLKTIDDGVAELRLRPKWCLHGLGGHASGVPIFGRAGARPSEVDLTITLNLPSWVEASQTKFVSEVADFLVQREPRPPIGGHASRRAEFFGRAGARPYEELRVIMRTNVDVGAEGTLTVITQAGNHRHEAQWKLQVVREPTTLLRLDSDQVPFFWGICRRGQSERADDGKSGATFYRHDGMPVGGVSKPGFFSHPPYIGGVGYVWAQFGPIELPNEPCEFRSWVGLMDGGDPSDGVMFIVEVVDENGQRHRLTELHGVQGKWRELVADLTKFSGQKVWLRLIADVGPNDNSTADWASWGMPRVELKTLRRRIEIQ